jgi:hypothetical protein
MNPAGTLSIRAAYVDGAVQVAAVSLQRPPLTRLFVGRDPRLAVRMLPHLYALCSQAQRASALAALAAAEGAPAGNHAASRSAMDDHLLWLERLHEHFWRLLLDWPAACGLAPAHAEFAAWRAARQQGDEVAATQRLIADSLRPRVEKCLALLVDREPAVPPLAQPDPAAWLPWLRGASAAPPPAAFPGSIAAAFRARVAEVEAAATALADGAPYPVFAAGGDGFGVAQSLTARGLLTHALVVDGAEVARYHLLAPTDASFADAGPLAALLAGQVFATPVAARQALETAILALDPCLPHTVEWTHA